MKNEPAKRGQTAGARRASRSKFVIVHDFGKEVDAYAAKQKWMASITS
ncbi:hypothetical protein [Paenibacillus sp. GCM10023250]